MNDFTGYLIIGLLILLGLIGLFGIRYDTTRAGEHSGYVTAVEQGGFIWHNYNIYFKTDNSSSQEDTYCVQEADRELANTLREANKSRKQVTIRYEGIRGWGYSLCDLTKIVSVE